MLSVTTLTSLAIATLIVAAMPVVLYRMAQPRFGIDPREAILGVAVFAFFAMVIERAVHGFMLSQASTMAWLANPRYSSSMAS